MKFKSGQWVKLANSLCEGTSFKVLGYNYRDMVCVENSYDGDDRGRQELLFFEDELELTAEHPETKETNND